MKKNKTNLIVIMNCVLACTFLLISGTLAAYTSLSNAKRTVSTVGSKQLFSSNILVDYDDEKDIQGKSMTFSSDVNENTFFVSVCNYAQGDKTKWASNDVHYSVNISLVDLNGNTVTEETVLSKYRWNKIVFSELSQPITGILSNETASEQMYTVTVPTEYMKDYRIRITADSSIPGYKRIGRVVSVAEEIATSEWKINYLNIEQQEAAYDLGCINTKLTGSEHVMLTLSWDYSHVEIDPWFLEDIGVAAPNPEAGWKSITFEVGGTDAEGNARPNQYSVTFYRTKAVRSDDNTPEDWDNIKSYIQLSSNAVSE